MKIRLRIPPKAQSPEPRTASPLEDVVGERGQELDPEVRAEFEARFQRGLGHIRVHDGPAAEAAARRLDARALAVGAHLVFAAGQYRPHSFDGRRLLAHEIAHAIQGSNALALIPALDQDPDEASDPRVGADESQATEVGESVVGDAEAERTARIAAGVATLGRLTATAPSPLASMKGPTGLPRIHRFPAAVPIRDVAAPLADPMVELLAIDIARALEADPADASGRTRRRVTRLAESMRAAVVTRVGELLTPAQRQQAADALTGAAIGEEREGRSRTKPTPASARAMTPAEAARSSSSTLILGPSTSGVGATATEAAAGAAAAPETAAATAAGRGAAAGAAQSSTGGAATTARAAAVDETPARGGTAGAVAAGGAAAGAAAASAAGAAAVTGQAAGGAAATETAAGAATSETAEPAESGAAAGPGGEAASAAAGGSPAATGSAAATGEAAGTAGSSQPDLSPFDELETRLAERQRVEDEAAREAMVSPPAAAAPPAPIGVMSSGESEAALDVPSMPSTEDGSVAETVAQAATVGSTVGTPRAASAQASGAAAAPAPPEPMTPPPAAEEPPATSVAPPVVAEPATESQPPSGAAGTNPDSGETAGPSLSPDELALATQAAPPATPELEDAIAEAEGSQPDVPATDVPATGRGPTVDVAPVVTEASAAAIEPTTATARTEAARAPVGDSVAPANVPAPVGEGPGAAAGQAAIETDPGAVETQPTPEGVASPEAGGGETTTPAEGLAAGAQATGDCGPDTGGGGSAGAAIPEPEVAAAPDVSASPPADAMGAIAQLPPAEMGVAIAGVGASASGSIAAGRAQLAAQPPTLERPAGSPQTRPAGAASAVANATAAAPAPPTPVAGITAPPGTTAAVTPLPSSGALPTQGVATPAVAGGPQREVTAADAQALRASVDELPVTDPALAIDAGPAPSVTLDGDADPNLARDQRAQVEDRSRVAREQGQVEAARPLGENDIYPTVPAETLTAEITPATPAPAPNAVDAPDEPTAIVAREQHSDEVRAAATTAQGQMVAERQSHDEHLVEGRAAAQQEMDAQVQANAEQQAEQRRGAGADVVRERGRWTAEQETAVGTGRSEADTEHTRATTQVESERRTADREAAGRIEQGNTEAATARTNAERNARAERDRGKNESRGVLGWLADRARGFFDALKRGLQAIFNAARAVVRRAIEAAQRLASGIIDAARRRIVGLIRAVGTALIAIADRVLAAFPALRDRFRAAIRRVVDAAVAAVNRLADALKEGIRRALSALGSLIEGALGLLERAYMAAIDVVAGAVRSVIRAAQAIVQLIGEFAALIRDVAADPMGWLRNLGASIVDGLRNHVWRVLKCKVKEWFNSKVEEVLGLGRMIFQLLRSGGIRFAEIGRMVWDALKAALPGIAIQLAIEKLVSLLVPAASAIMLIIDGLKAAWGAISRIIAAIEAFFTFLRAVKTGNAGRQFAEALAGGAVALIDFLSNFLVGKLKGPASGVGGRLSGIAARLGRVGGAVARGARSVGRVVRRVAPGLARVAGRVGGVVVAGARVIGRGARAVGRGVVTGVRAVGRGVRAVGRGIVTGVRAVGRGVFAGARAVGRVIASGARAVGRGIASAARSAGRRIAGAARSAIAALARRFPRVAAALRRARAAWDRARTRFREWRERRRQRRRETNEQRLERATNALRPQIGGLLRNRVWAMRLRLQLAAWRLWYRLRRLSLARTAGGHSIVIGNSPDRVLIDRVVQAAEPNLHRTLVELSEAIINEPEVIEAAEDIMDQRMIGRGKTPLDPIVIPPSPGGAAASRDIRNIAIFGQAGVRARGRAAGGPWSAGRIGRSEVRPEQEWLALAPQYGFAASDVYLGRRGKFHPGSLVVIGPQSYASLRRVTPARPGVIESAAFALQGGRMPPGLTVPEQYYAAGIGRVSQVEAGRFSAGLAQERMLGHLAATGAIPAELRHGALSPASMASAGSAARAVDIRSGIVHQGGPGDLSPEGTLGALPSAGVRHDLARAYLDRERRLVVEFVYREIQLENAMSDDPAALMAWMRDKFRARLREVMMAERAGSTSVSSGLP